jgi:NADPH-dependent glutamate synthase beta subunit-like oxidoreductase/nitroreductase/NAD-dependent dihydropyrimidine dehydrogenase PreA subunit
MTEREKGDTSMSESFQTSKFSYLSDPPVATRPFTIIVDGDKCIGCGVCIKQCPCQTIEMVKRAAASEKQQPACQFRCPSGIDVRGYLKILADGGTMEDAWRLVTDANPLPAVTGRVCPHPCEASCNRSGLDSGVNIHTIERAIGDYGIEKGLAFEKPAKAGKEKVAVVGAGPSGMSCAYQLARMGYPVTVFEASDRPGGMLSAAIPGYRLPEDVVSREMQRIVDLGVTLSCNTTVGKDITLDELKKKFKAVYLAIGAQAGTAMGISGEDAPSVLTGLAFLKSIKDNKPLAIGKKVLVVGGGNTAVDAARAARRIGSDVKIIYRRTLAQMPAYAEEVEAAMLEGIAIDFLCAPVKIEGNGKGLTATCQKMELGSPDASGRPAPVPVKGSEFGLAFDTIISAIGQNLMAAGLEPLVGKSPWIIADAFGQTGEQGVFAGGDAASGPGMVAEAIGAGHKAALAVDAYIRGVKPGIPEMKEISYQDVPLNDKKKIARKEAGKLGVKERLAKGDAEVSLPLAAAAVLEEGKRCLVCGLQEPKFTGQQYFGKICIACHSCEAICPQGAISFPHYYRVDKGRWAYDFDYPEKGMGLPNPLRLEKPVPLTEIESELTETEKVIYNRRSTRVYKPDPVPKEVIHRILEAGRFAPSAGNCQGWKFVVVTDRALLTELSVETVKFLSIFTRLYQGKGPLRTSLKNSLAFLKPNAIDQRPMCAIQALRTPKFGEGELDVFFGAPAAIFLLTHHLHISEPSLGMGICGQNMVLAAHSLGIGTCYVGFSTNVLNMDPVAKKKFHKRLGIEWPYDTVATILTIGYPSVKIDRPVEREIPKVLWVE